MAAVLAKAKVKSMVDAVDAVDAVKAVKAEIATEMGNRLSAPIAKLTAIPQMQAENGNALWREETAEVTAEESMSTFATSAGAALNFSKFKTLSFSIVIELGDNNSVTVMHYSFVDVIQGYQVKALHTPTFQLALLSNNQLNLGRHATILFVCLF